VNKPICFLTEQYQLKYLDSGSSVSLRNIRRFAVFIVLYRH